MPKKQPTAPDPDDLPSDRHKYPVMSVRPPDPMRRVITELARGERRSLSQTILFLLEEALAARGLWPPPDQSS
jgi:hypothetical protein